MKLEGKSDFIKRIPEILKFWIKENSFLLIIIVLNILLHLPRTSHMRGNDAYAVVWMAQAMNEGWFEAWTIHPFSFFGYFPYSQYPIGGILILSLFLKMGMSIDLAVYMFSILFMILGIIFSYFLGKTLFKTDKNLTCWFVLFYTLSPIFIDLTNWTSSLRGPFLAVLPLALAFLIRFTKTPNFKNGISLIVSSIFLLSLHALLVGYLVYIAVAIITLSVPRLIKLINRDKIRNIRLISRYKVYFILLIYFIIFIISLFVIGARGWVINYFTHEPIYIQTLVQNKFVQILLIGLNYFLSEYGIIILLFFLGFIFQFKESTFKENKEVGMFFITSGFFLSMIISFTDYGPLFILPWICFYASLSMRFLHSRLKDKKKVLLTIQFWIIFFIFLQRIGLSFMSLLFLILLSVGSVILVVFSLYENFKSKLARPHTITKIAFIIVISLVFNLTIFTSLDDYGNKFPSYSLSEDEIEIAEYLKLNNFDTKLIISYNSRIARRIQAFGFQPIIPSENPPAILYYSYLNLDKEYILSATEFSLSYIFRYGTPYVANITELSYELYNLYENSLELDLRNISDYNIAVDVYHMGYVLLSINSSENIPINNFSTNLFDSIIETGIIRIETTHLILYELDPPT